MDAKIKKQGRLDFATRTILKAMLFSYAIPGWNSISDNHNLRLQVFYFFML